MVWRAYLGSEEEWVDCPTQLRAQMLAEDLTTRCPHLEVHLWCEDEDRYEVWARGELMLDGTRSQVLSDLGFRSA
jgi:hypothetical protein